MRQKHLYWRINEKISNPTLRVIGENGKQLGILKIEKALAKAKKAGLDLIEIAPKAKPPVAKIADFGKFRYQEEKKLKKQRRNTKSPELKEIRFSPFIGQGDYETRINRLKGFMGDGHKVKIVVKFKGRQMGSKKYGYGLLNKIAGELGENINIDMEPKFVGRHLTTVVSPMGKAGAKKKDAKAPVRNAAQSVTGGKN